MVEAKPPRILTLDSRREKVFRFIFLPFDFVGRVKKGKLDAVVTVSVVESAVI
jgi:hypothetical protein